MEFEIWKITFLKSILPLRNYGIGFRFSDGLQMQMIISLGMNELQVSVHKFFLFH